ncbi:MAG: type II secretion system minor pseudopilin GspK [Steroidobacteraceae bacterium]
MTSRARQRGIAMMTAVMLVALATVLAVSIKFKDVMASRRAGAIFSVEQDVMFAAGAEAVAAYALREDLANNKIDHDAEPWHKHYGPVEISDAASEGAPQGALEAQLEDESGKFNLNSLIDSTGAIDKVAVQQLEFLLQELGLQTHWAEKMADWIDEDNATGTEDGVYSAQSPSYLTANLPVTSISELLQLPEFGRDNYDLLAPFVAALPTGTLLNICTANEKVLNAFISGVQNSPYKQSWPKISATGGKCFPTSQDLANVLSDPKFAPELTRRIAQSSDYFRLETLVSIGTTQFALYSLMYRTSQGVRPVLRTYGTD